MRSRTGMTLIEVVVVIFILVLLMTVLVPYVGGATERMHLTTCQRNLNQVGAALSAHAAQGSLATGAMPRFARGTAWYGAALSMSSQEVLECPKGSFRVSGGASPRGWVTPIEPPPSARFDERLEHLKEIRFWKEREGYRLPQAVTVDIHTPGTYDTEAAWKGNRTSIPAGTVVDIWFCHYDSVGATNTQSDGGVQFDYELLGAIVEDDTLDASDSVCGHPGTVYHTGRNARGFENKAEVVTFEPDRRTFTINRFQITSPGEEVRFLVAAPAASSGRALRCSYGINNALPVAARRNGQVMIVEYDRLLADVDGDATDDDLAVHLQDRHYGKVNTLFVDGTVRLLGLGELMTDANAPSRQWQP